jgi:hypothetical protein
MVCFRARLTFMFMKREPVNFRARLSSHRIFMRRQPFAIGTINYLSCSGRLPTEARAKLQKHTHDYQNSCQITPNTARSCKTPVSIHVSCNITTFRLLNTYRRCGGACWLHLQYRAIREPQISQISVASLSNKSSDFLIFNSIIYSISINLQFLRLITD